MPDSLEQIEADISPLRADSIRQLPTGGLAVDATIARCGVFEYRAGGTIRREFRPPEAVFERAALMSLVGATVTVDHPPGIEVTTENYRGVTVGTVAEVRRDGDRIAAVLHIHDRATIESVLAKKLSDISPAYKSYQDPSPGVDPLYGPYDARTQRMIFNHVSLLPPGAGRQGEQVSIRLDSADQPVVELSGMKPEDIQKLIESMLPNFDELAAKVAETVAGQLPALVQSAVSAAVAESAGAEPAEEMPAADAAKTPEQPVEEPAPAAAPAEMPMEKRADARVIAIVREVERVTGKPADLSRTSKELLTGAVKVAGIELRADASEDFMLGALSAYRPGGWRRAEAPKTDGPADRTAEEWNKIRGPGRPAPESRV